MPTQGKLPLDRWRGAITLGIAHGLSPAQRLTLERLALHDGPGGCRIGLTRLALETGVSERGVRLSIGALVALGLVSRRRSGRSFTYRIAYSTLELSSTIKAAAACGYPVDNPPRHRNSVPGLVNAHRNSVPLKVELSSTQGDLRGDPTPVLPVDSEGEPVDNSRNADTHPAPHTEPHTEPQPDPHTPPETASHPAQPPATRAAYSPWEDTPPSDPNAPD